MTNITFPDTSDFISKTPDGADQQSIDALVALTRQDIEEAKKIIAERSQSYVGLIPELANHLISSGGKHIRPMVHSALCQIFSYEGRARYLAAASVEFLHTATLLHDDVVDESDLRRGKKAARLIWGNQASVLVGDYLLGQCFNMMVEADHKEALNCFSKAAVVLAEGEVLQLVSANNAELTKQDYYKIVEAKTAALFVASSEMAGLLAEQDQQTCKLLADFGFNLGILFQLVDDLLDYQGADQKFGKEIGDDFREGKVTLPVIIARDQGTEKEREFWIRVFEDPTAQSEDDFGRALSLLKKYKAIETCSKEIDQYALKAVQTLKALPDHPAKDALIELVAFCKARTS